MNSFFTGFEKQAFNLRDARKASSAIRDVFKRNIPKSKESWTVSPKGALYAKGNLTKQILDRGSGRIYNRVEAETRTMKDNPYLKDIRANAVKGMTDLSTKRKERPRLKSPESMEMANRIGLLHESWERASPTKGADFIGTHASPSVILKEHNAIATLPKKYKDVKEYFKHMRKKEESHIQKLMPDFRYGEGRISRHKIKQIESAWKTPAKEDTGLLGKLVHKIKNMFKKD